MAEPETPGVPVCPRLYNLMLEAKSVEAVREAFRHHERFCLICAERRAA